MFTSTDLVNYGLPFAAFTVVASMFMGPAAFWVLPLSAGITLVGGFLFMLLVGRLISGRWG